MFPTTIPPEVGLAPFIFKQSLLMVAVPEAEGTAVAFRLNWPAMVEASAGSVKVATGEALEIFNTRVAVFD